MHKPNPFEHTFRWFVLIEGIAFTIFGAILALLLGIGSYIFVVADSSSPPTILSLIFIAIQSIVIGSLLGAFTGAVFGVSLGIVNGFVLWLLVANEEYLVRNFHQQKRLAQILSASIALLLIPIILVFAGYGDWIDAFLMTSPALVASVISIFVMRRYFTRIENFLTLKRKRKSKNL